MNEYQKAFKKIDDYVWGKDEPHWQEISSAFEKMKELVDRAAPKNPKIVREPFAYISYNCGECDEPVLRSWAGERPRMMPKFCQYCGQAIDWGND